MLLKRERKKKKKIVFSFFLLSYPFGRMALQTHRHTDRQTDRRTDLYLIRNRRKMGRNEKRIEEERRILLLFSLALALALALFSSPLLNKDDKETQWDARSSMLKR